MNTKIIVNQNYFQVVHLLDIHFDVTPFLSLRLLDKGRMFYLLVGLDDLGALAKCECQIAADTHKHASYGNGMIALKQDNWDRSVLNSLDTSHYYPDCWSLMNFMTLF